MWHHIFLLFHTDFDWYQILLHLCSVRSFYVSFFLSRFAMNIFAVGWTFPVVNSHFVAIFRDLILLHIILILAYFTLLPSLEFSSNADFSNFQSFAWQVIDYLIWIAKYLDRQNSPKSWRTTFVPGWNPDSDLQHRRGAAVLWPPQRDLPEEGEEPQRRVGLGGQHWQLHTVCRGDKLFVIFKWKSVPNIRQYLSDDYVTIGRSRSVTMQPCQRTLDETDM